MLDWDDLRFFLSIARHGSLTAAASELRVAQSTVGRRLASLEAGLGVRLLHRTPDGYVLTLAGESVRAQAERAEAEVTDLAPRARLGLQTSSHEALLSTARSGGGLACLARFRADVETGLSRLKTPSVAPTTDIWLVVHKDSRNTPRVRATLTAITKCVRALSAVLDPTDESSKS